MDESASTLTGPGRFVLGDAVPYPADPSLADHEGTLHRSQARRRDVGWEIARRAVAPVEVTSSSGTFEVPLFETWYGAEDLRRVGLHLQETRTGDPEAPYTEAELDEAFAWNTTAVYEQEAWPADRLAEYVAAIATEERARGAGGIERITFDPRAARHLLASRGDFERCTRDGLPGPLDGGPGAETERRTETFALASCGARTLGAYRVAPGGTLRASVAGDVELSLHGAPDARCTASDCEVSGPADVRLVARPRTATASTVEVSWDARQGLYVPCLDGEFPAGSAILKADYRRVGFGVLLPVFDTSAEGLAKMRTRDGDWEDGGDRADPGPGDIFTLELPNGNRFRLAALHVMTKELDHWAWVTLWWSDAPDLDFGADRPPGFAGTPWDAYKMCVATEFSELDPDPTGGVRQRSLASALAAVYEGVGGPSWCSNPYLERGAGNGATNCIGCHQHGGDLLTAEEILGRPHHGRLLERRNFPADYTFAADEVTALLR